MKMDPKTIIKVDTSAFRTIHVEFNQSILPESFADLPTFEIRDGLRTKFCRPHHRKETLVTISWLDLETPDDLITHVFSHFGTLKSNIQWCKIKQESQDSEEAKLLNNILSGERQLWIELDKPLPSYASIDQRKVKIFHHGQKRTCARCQMDGESCPGRANAKQCEENGGDKTNVEIAWKNILTSVGYTEWTGGNISMDAQGSQEESSKEEDQVDDVSPILGCVGLVLDNLEENMKDEDIKSLLKNACSTETLEKCSIHPTGSLRSKIVKISDINLIPSIAKKVDKKSVNGRMVFCKPFVPKTPPKVNPTPNNETKVQESSSNKSSPSNRKDDNKVTSNIGEKPTIPGLNEEVRIKAVKKKAKIVNKRKSNENLDVVTLTRKDFLKNQEKKSDSEELTEKFEFSDDGSESDVFEDTKNVDDAAVGDDGFSTPYRFKSSYASHVARSESRVRSRSVSVKRAPSFDADDDEEISRKQRNMKSGIPARRNYSDKNKKSIL